MPRFVDIHAFSIDGAIVLVDVNGTITHDRSEEISKEVEHVLKNLAARNRVYVCSNDPDTERISALARKVKIPSVSSEHKKPCAHILHEIPDSSTARIVVIGDKRWTDGRLARNIGAEFIQVRRIVRHSDRLSITLSYLVDDLWGNISHMLRVLRPSKTCKCRGASPRSWHLAR